MRKDKPVHVPRIVVVGGGAGGLELATQLGRRLGRKKKAQVTLVDSSRTHIWKPLLHEVAAGTMDSHDDEIEYLAQASDNHFRFVLGSMAGLDRRNKLVQIAPLYSSKGELIVPERTVEYDYLIMAVGSVCNDFGVPGASTHCMFLDTTKEAEDFQEKLLGAYLRAQASGGARQGELDVVIVGGGATGIELSAQLYHAAHLLNSYGLDNVQPSDIKIHIVESAPVLLGMLPARLSAATLAQLHKLGIDVRLGVKVVEVLEEGVRTESGEIIRAAAKVWAAGVKAPDFLHELDGLETNRINQLVVTETLQTTRDPDIYALGDCAACKWPGKEANVPPRAQAAHQMAELVFENLKRRMKNKSQKPFKYLDYGSLVSLGKYSTVGNLMGNLMGSVMIEGFIARLVYLSLYKMHQMALFGPFRMSLIVLSSFFRNRIHPKIKLH
jgi:NADH:ubiquinone reductase (H+-translocating)